MVISLERDADLHMAQLVPLPLTVSCFSKIQIGFTFLVQVYPGSPGQRKWLCVSKMVHCMRVGTAGCCLSVVHGRDKVAECSYNDVLECQSRPRSHSYRQLRRFSAYL